MEQNKALISVIIPVYNREAYIEECLNSVLKQSYQNFEIIIVDDGSTDNTLQICNKLAAEEKRIRILSGGHQGVSAARNLALDHAEGDYLFFIDSDDVMDPRLLRTLLEAMEEKGAQVGGSVAQSISYAHWDKLAAHIEKDMAPGETTFQDHEQTMHAVFHSKTPLGNIGGVMIRRDLIGDTRFSEELFIGEDFYFIYENLIKGASSVFLKQRWYYARIHKQNTSNHFGYEGFYTRFLRRKLVWESEVALGRPENADVHKKSAVNFYHKFLTNDILKKEERKKMCQILRQHEKDLMTCVSGKAKLYFWFSLYFPKLFTVYYRHRHPKQKNGIWSQ